ncbi:hypothetical protein C8Q78DRAFT_345363 [Trametes maxima]|nr:hypothetical protein C8Q78DRAFT_345363 [Trametes maxima]
MSYGAPGLYPHSGETRDHPNVPQVVPSDPQGVASAATSQNPPGWVRLSWAGIVNIPGPRTIDVIVDRTHFHYRHYEECISYLQQEYPVQSIAAWEDLKKCSVKDLHRSFGVLINLLADRNPSLNGSAERSEAPVPYSPTNMLDFIYRGALAITLMAADFSDVAHTLIGRSEGDPSRNLCFYSALFLYRITHLWTTEYLRRSQLSLFTPMPWSDKSKEELLMAESAELIPELEICRTRPLAGDVLCEEDHPMVSQFALYFGFPLDVPWYDARHDGYPFCSTLSCYTAVRRISTDQSFLDDAALWMSAMTFGLLEAVTRSRISESVFLTPGQSNDGLVISGPRILRFLVHWFCSLVYRQPNNHDLEHGREVAQLLHRALSALDEEENNASSIFYRAGFDEDEVKDMVCAVALIIVPLCRIANFIWGERLPGMRRLTDRQGCSAAIYLSCSNRMRRAGWCPTIASIPSLGALMDLPSISNFCRLSPHVRGAVDEHKDCTPDACTFYTFSPAAVYNPRHVHPSCHCGDVRPPLSEIEYLLSQDKIPIVVWDGTKLLVRSSSDCQYVSISHVWADRMGSTAEKGLPACVVARIAGLVECLLPESQAFWMDSLCVPSAGDLRRHAINQMAQTYRAASKVLVIDETIRTECLTLKPWWENLFRIAMSGWVRRIWTLQEGILARELYFEFFDGPVRVEEELILREQRHVLEDSGLWDSSQISKLTTLQTFATVVPMLNLRQRYQRPGTVLQMPLNEVIQSLRFRSTSHAEDELIAISCLLPDIDLNTLLAIRGTDPEAAQKRMKAFLLSLGDVPKTFAIISLPRLTLPGFTWAPRSLADIERVQQDTGGEVALCTKEGLLAEYAVLVLNQPFLVADLPTKNKTESTGRVAIAQAVYTPLGMGYNIMLDLDMLPSPNDAIFDGLLLMQESLVVEQFFGGAVVWGVGLGPEDGDLDGTPQRLTYVAPCIVQRMDFPPCNIEDYATLEKASTRLVLLT